MSVRLTRYYRDRPFPVGALLSVYKHLEISWGSVSISAGRSLGSDTSETRDLAEQDITNSTSLADYNHMLFTGPYPESLGIHRAPGSRYLLSLESGSSGGELMALAEDVTAMLALEEHPLEPDTACDRLTADANPVSGIEARLDRLESIVLRDNQPLTCFLSYRFSAENVATVAELSRFLEALGITVVNPSVYEPRPITAKVRDKISRADFIVQIITSSGQSAWTSTEAGAATTMSLPVVPLIEDGVTFEPGLLGDLEWIPFARGHIADTFTSVLDAIKYLRLLKDTERASPDIPAPGEERGQPPLHGHDS